MRLVRCAKGDTRFGEARCCVLRAKDVQNGTDVQGPCCEHRVAVGGTKFQVEIMKRLEQLER
jgi:hypothetical protein